MDKIIKKLQSIYRIFKLKSLYKNRINIGKRVGILKGVNIIVGKKGRLKIKSGCFFNNYCSINCLGNIVIDEDCIFGEGVKLYDHNHKYRNNDERIKEQGFTIGSINIGKNCWIGSNVVILNNVTIGDNVVIGANCLIYKSIPSNCIVKSESNLIVKDLYKE